MVEEKQNQTENERALRLAASRKNDTVTAAAEKSAAKKVELMEAAIVLGAAALIDGASSLVIAAGSAILFFLPGAGVIMGGIIKLTGWGIMVAWAELRGLKAPWSGYSRLTGGLSCLGMALITIGYNNSPKLQAAAGLNKIA
ncbi:MAG: hypothetical protein HYW09_01625 [Candidatus Niyogibacteria bacterium]|nr:hypothetical protein [Candidatus Niyogibacteria bacterium]